MNEQTQKEPSFYERSALKRYYKNVVILTDFNCGISNAQIEMRFQSVFRHMWEDIEKKGMMYDEIVTSPWRNKGHDSMPPSVTNIHNIPFGNMDYAGYALYALYRTLGRNTRPNIFVHVTDPGVGDGEDRSILVTDQGNIMIGPNNGTLAMIGAYFKTRNIPYTIYTIDQPLVERLEKLRMESPSYETPLTFHGRDIFAVVAGLIAAGATPESLAVKKENNQQEMVHTRFAQGFCALPTEKGKCVTFSAFRDNTFGNLKTNLSLDAQTLDALVEEGARYKIWKKGKCGTHCKLFGKKFTFPVRKVFAHSKAGEPVLYLGSTFSVNWDERLVELAVNYDPNTKDAAALLEVPIDSSSEFVMVRVK